MRKNEHNIVRGEVWIAELERGGDHAEQSRVRLALVISATELNTGALGTATILPVTTRRLDVPSHILLEPPEGGVLKTSYIACDKIYTIPSERLLRKLGIVKTETIGRVEDTLSMILGLDR